MTSRKSPAPAKGIAILILPGAMKPGAPMRAAGGAPPKKGPQQNVKMNTLPAPKKGKGK